MAFQAHGIRPPRVMHLRPCKLNSCNRFACSKTVFELVPVPYSSDVGCMLEWLESPAAGLSKHMASCLPRDIHLHTPTVSHEMTVTCLSHAGILSTPSHAPAHTSCQSSHDSSHDGQAPCQLSGRRLFHATFYQTYTFGHYIYNRLPVKCTP